MKAGIELKPKPKVFERLKDVATDFQGSFIDFQAGKLKEDLEKVVAPWKTSVQFTIRTQGESRIVSTESKVYKYVTLGTAPHVIRPKTAKVLRFKAGYTAATSPGSLQTGSGRADGEEMFRREVNHPGIKPRRFEKLVAEKFQKTFAKEVSDKLKKAASG